MNNDSNVNVFDMVVLKRTILSNSAVPEEPDDPVTNVYSITYEDSAVTLMDENGTVVSECDCIAVNGQTVTITTYCVHWSLWSCNSAVTFSFFIDFLIWLLHQVPCYFFKIFAKSNDIKLKKSLYTQCIMRLFRS